jgi:prolyl-tRNA synthetase
VEVGNIFKLGTYYSEALGCSFLDKDGKALPVVMGSYGIGLGRLLATIAEIHHDDYGLTLPFTVAPFDIHIVLLPPKHSPDFSQTAEKLYTQLQQVGLTVLMDDREYSAGSKFADADLIGIPIRLTLSSRSLKNGGVEVKLRSEDHSKILPLEGIEQEITKLSRELREALNSKITPVEYRE